MLYEESKLIGDNDANGGSGVGNNDVYKDNAEPMLDSVSDLYSEDDSISVHNSRPSSSPAYTITDYFYRLTTVLRKRYIILS